MATATTPTPKQMLAQHAKLVKAYEDSENNGQKANRSREIRAHELDMVLNGVEFTPWAKPRTARKSKLPEIPQEQIEADIAKAYAVASADGDVPKTVKRSANQRIAALVKAAVARGYEVKDPRPQEDGATKS